MFKKINPAMLHAYNDTRKIFQKELDKLEMKSRTTPLNQDDEFYKIHLETLLDKLLLEEMRYIHNNVNFPKRFWRKITKKMKK